MQFEWSNKQKVPYAIHEYDVDTAHLDAIHAAQGMGIPG